MVEEIDHSLLRIAAFNLNSSAEVRDLASTWKHPDEAGVLGNLFPRLQANEAKWLTRLILKNYAPVKVPDTLDLTAEHSFLPNCISVSMRMPSSSMPAIRKDGTGMIRGVASSHPNPLHTPPTSSLPCSSAARPVMLAEKIRPRVFPGSHSDPSIQSNVIEQSSGLQVLRLSPQTSAIPISTGAPSSTRPVLGMLSSNVPHVPRQSTPPKGSQVAATVPLRIVGHGICGVTVNTCKFTRCLFLWSPCIADTPWLMDDLLPRHGARVLTSLSALSHPSLPRYCPQSGRRYRKIALVESNRIEQTAAFLKKIGKLGLKRKGKKEWVEVYDWRLLECFTKVEQGKETGYDPWKRCWIGAV